MIIKSYIIEKSFDELNKFKLILFYGENEGLKKNFRDLIRINYKNAEIFNLFQDEIIKDEKKLFNNLHNSSLFYSNKIFLIQEASDKICEIMLKILDQNFSDAKIFIFSNNLDKKSKLRNLFEKEKALVVVPCYADNFQTLNYYIKNKLGNFNGLTPDIINLIIENSSGKREIIDNEIKKINTFFENKKISSEELNQLLNIKYDNVFEDLRDAIFNGNLIKLNKLISETQFLNEDNFYYLNQIYMRINKLIEVHEIDKKVKNLEKSVEMLKPKIFWKDKNQFIQQARKVNLSLLKKIIIEISDTEILMKKNSYIRSDLLLKKLIISIGAKISSHA